MINKYVVTQLILGGSGSLDISKAEYEDLGTAIERLGHVSDAEEKFAAFIDKAFGTHTKG